MANPIIVMSTQYPGYGGASTNAYAIVKYLREKGYNTIGVFIEDNVHINVDPDNIGGIFRISLYPFNYNIQARINEYKMKFAEPSIIICKNYFAPVCAKRLFPNTKNIYLVSGLCNAIEICDKIPANLIVSKNIVIPKSENEIKAFNNSDLIVVNSQLTFKIFNTSFPEYQTKLYPKIVDTTRYARYLINSNDHLEKKYDFLIVSSILTRKEKNNVFLIDVLKNPLFNKFSKIIIGNNNELFEEIPNSTIHPLLAHDEVMKLMKETKVLLYPSLYDSNPNTIREAVHNKCLILMSNNIGYYEAFPSYSVCQTFEHSEWTSKSIYLVENYSSLIPNYQIKFNTDTGLEQLINSLL